MKTLRLILGDQLNAQHSWFQEVRPEVVYVLMEVRQETDYVRHHVQKVVAFFAAMRAFAEMLRHQGHQVAYLTLDDPRNQQTLPENLKALLHEHQASRLEWMLPDEWRVDQQLQAFAASLELETAGVDSEHFFEPREALGTLFRGKKTYLMETFYRKMRQQHQVLVEGGKPVGGKWNFDQENRKRYDGAVPLPPVPHFHTDVSDLVRLLTDHGVTTVGSLAAGDLRWPVTREQGLQALEHFVQERLPFFGTYQDALTEEGPFLFHSLLSFALNVKLLSPREVVDRAIQEWKQRPEAISLAQLEGFVRQILGWREYMRGVYWAEMPGYRSQNFLEHDRPLPEWFWTGETQMRCLRQAVTQSLEHAYAHHIQRLMVTGNFALLAGVDPEAVDAWYLGIYVDALEWVELPNTRGMRQYADGGQVATKPYAASAKYLNRMGDHCVECAYDPKQKTGPRACPFNALYWEFFVRHRERLQGNHRIGMTYRTWDKMAPEAQQQLLEQASSIREHLEVL